MFGQGTFKGCGTMKRIQDMRLYVVGGDLIGLAFFR